MESSLYGLMDFVLTLGGVYGAFLFVRDTYRKAVTAGL